MSTRSNVTVLEQNGTPEIGPIVQAWENADVTNGNKLYIEPRVVVVFFNSSAATKTITYTYDDGLGQVRTLVVTIAIGGMVTVQLRGRMGNHASDTAENGFAWFTASGVAGDVKMRATRLPLLND